VSIPGVFSGGIRSSTIRSSVFSQAQSQYYTDSLVTYALYTDTLAENEGGAWSPALTQALQALPPFGPGNESAYWDFFNMFGTHYISSVTWGGQASTSFSVSTSLVSSGKISESNLGLFATFKTKLLVGSSLSPEGDASWDTKTKEQWSVFDSFAISVFEGKREGGDVTIKDIQPWLESVPHRPVVIQRKLSPYSIVARSVAPAIVADLTNALYRYFDLCKIDGSGKVCSEHGVCAFEEVTKPRTCRCDPGWAGPACEANPGDVSQFPKPGTVPSVMLWVVGNNPPPPPSPAPLGYWLFYNALVPAPTIDPKTMTEWKNKKFTVSVAAIVSGQSLVVPIQLSLDFGGKFPGFSNTWLQVTVTSFGPSSPPNPVGWAASTWLFTGAFFIRDGYSHLCLNYGLHARYGSTSVLPHRNIRVRSDGVVEYNTC